jgi:hypothetical protein
MLIKITIKTITLKAKLIVQIYRLPDRGVFFARTISLIRLFVGRAACLPDRPLRPPDKGQIGVDQPSMVNLKGQTGAGALPWTATSDCQSPCDHVGKQQ